MKPLFFSFAFADEPSKVLLINSYHPQYRWTAELTRGVQDVLAQQIPAENLYIEYMDARRFVDDFDFLQTLIVLFKYKYTEYQPDIIITSDDAAYYFMLEHGDSIFPGVPVVFCGVNVFEPELLSGKAHITGIREGMDILGNLELIRQLQPGVQRIILLGDTTGLGLRMTERAREIKLAWSKSLQRRDLMLEIWDDFSLEELYQQAANLAPGTVLLMLAIHKDRLGHYFSYHHDLPKLTQSSKVPVYGMWGTLMIGNGAVGGMMNDPYDHGAEAAEMALDILGGVPVSAIKIREKAKYSPVFDYHQLSRFNIDLDLLPKNSQVINHPVSLYEKHRLEINSIIGIVMFLIMIISILYLNNQELELVVRQRTRDLDLRNKALEASSNFMRHQANTDVLTNLANRRAGLEEISGYIRRFNRDDKAFALAIVDIDFFKRINDTYGHDVGDKVLQVLGASLKRLTRPGDNVYRWGGEEFLIILPYAGPQASLAICQRFRQKVSELVVCRQEEQISITVSIGVTNFIREDTFESLFARADKALYEAKRNGRNRVETA
ncbi:diguanylate cyclase [Thalassomonas viridans]|uniref:diguanylate cyclase n=1 Tax=Thalassomonas viridans TaxID=137584 RepID=A0AAE9Z3H3_9GAMM|nr:ABC transporter substrate binding protein [Thalassomonas viridans]WDE06066.1 diguanylate cyclase [Thalassomonas viridans]